MGLPSRPPGIAESGAVVNASKAKRVQGRVRECPPYPFFGGFAWRGRVSGNSFFGNAAVVRPSVQEPMDLVSVDFAPPKTMGSTSDSVDNVSRKWVDAQNAMPPVAKWIKTRDGFPIAGNDES